MEIQITFSDPKAYTRPWTITLHAELMADTELLENVCNENDKSTGRHFVVTDDDRRKAQSEYVVPADVLASYAGPYNMKVEGKSIPASVVLEHGRLFVVPPVGQVPALRGIRDDVRGHERRADDLSQGRERCGDRFHDSHRRRRSGVRAQAIDLLVLGS
jgi:hypothetical protein